MNINKIIEFNDNLQIADGVGFKFHNKGYATILSSNFAIMLNFLLVNSNKKHQKSLSNYLISQQQENGHFIDPNFLITDTSYSHDEDYVKWQFTYFTTIALDMIGQKPKFKFNFLEPLLEKNELTKWFNELDWNNFWVVSNQIMFLMYFLTYIEKRLGDDNNWIKDLINQCFDILDSKQDPNTGFWGTNINDNLSVGMYGAAHIYLFYDYYGRKINHVKKIIDNTLSLQNVNGLYGSKIGGACEDYDAIEVLSKISRHTDYKKEDINRAFLKTYVKINSSQDKNGGFSYCLKEDSLKQKFKEIIHFKSNKCTYSYSGWNKMQCDIFVPDVWATYFRTLTLAVIENDIPSLKGNKFNFYDLPAWGYYSNSR